MPRPKTQRPRQTEQELKLTAYDCKNRSKKITKNKTCGMLTHVDIYTALWGQDDSLSFPMQPLSSCIHDKSKEQVLQNASFNKKSKKAEVV